jgi:hypothetical protein
MGTAVLHLHLHETPWEPLSSISPAAVVPLLTADEHVYVISIDGSLPASLVTGRRDKRFRAAQEGSAPFTGALRPLSPVPSGVLTGALALDHDLPANMDCDRAWVPQE